MNGKICNQNSKNTQKYMKKMDGTIFCKQNNYQCK